MHTFTTQIRLILTASWVILCLDVRENTFIVCLYLQGEEAKYGIILKKFFFRQISPILKKKKIAINLNFHD